LAVQVGQGFPVLGQSQRLCLEPSHLRGRGNLRIGGTATHDLSHDRIKGLPVGIVNILVSCQSPKHRFPEQPVKTMDGVLAAPGVAKSYCRQIGQSERVIKLAHHQQPAIRTDLRAPELHPHAAVEIDPVTPLRSCTLWVPHKTSPS
jgi:hypothetical protein